MKTIVAAKFLLIWKLVKFAESGSDFDSGSAGEKNEGDPEFCGEIFSGFRTEHTCSVHLVNSYHPPIYLEVRLVFLIL